MDNDQLNISRGRTMEEFYESKQFIQIHLIYFQLIYLTHIEKVTKYK